MLEVWHVHGCRRESIEVAERNGLEVLRLLMCQCHAGSEGLAVSPSRAVWTRGIMFSELAMTGSRDKRRDQNIAVLARESMQQILLGTDFPTSLLHFSLQTLQVIDRQCCHLQMMQVAAGLFQHFAHTVSKAVNSDPIMTHINDLSNEVLLIAFNHLVYSSEDASSQFDHLHALADTCRRWLDITVIIYRKRLDGCFEDMDDRCRDCWIYYNWSYIVGRMARLPETYGIVWKSWKRRCPNSLAIGEVRTRLED